MDLVHQEYLTLPEPREDREELMGIRDAPRHDFHEPRVRLAGEETSDRRLPQPRPTRKEDVSERLPAPRGGGSRRRHAAPRSRRRTRAGLLRPPAALLPKSHHP